MNRTLQSALAYARLGWRVLPVVRQGKIPATQHGVNDATTDEAKIRSWFDSERGADLNIGVACGRASGIVVFDVDPRNGGDETWQMWLDHHGVELPAGAVQYTAGGGAHYVARWQEGMRSTKLADGIDFLSDGRYFVAYPSTIGSKSYEWEDGSRPIEVDPGEELAAPFVVPAEWVPSVVQQRQTPVAELLAGGFIQGNRNAGLTALAGAMRHHGMSEAEILAALTVANETRCEQPLPASEVKQIAHSVSRYDPEHDVAADTALGAQAIDDLLASERAKSSDYYGTPMSSLIGQPAPVDWTIQGWVPSAGVTMVYGESGAGKTFVTLDMACHVAAGKPWCGLPTKSGVAVYLAGEGNFGLRQRGAAWAAKHGSAGLERLIVTNKAIDADSGQEAVQSILRMVRESTSERVALLVVDTVNNHMVGDENLAKDVRALFGAVNTVAAALHCPVVLNHHVGHGEGAQRRARGSSAFKASLDASILVSSTNGQVLLTCTKMKDGPEPEPLHGLLETVTIPSWVGPDGTPVTGAVFALGPDQTGADGAGSNQHERAERPEPKLERWRNLYERAWWNSGAETYSGAPYLTRSALRDYLATTQRSMRASTIDQHLKASARPGSMVRDLIDVGYLEPAEHGWVVADHTHATALLLSSDSR